MGVDLFNTFILLLLVAAALTALRARDLITASVVFGVYSFLLLNGKSAISNPLSLIGNIMTLCTNVYICIYCTSLFWKNHVYKKDEYKVVLTHALLC